jgi:hypothetical protein
MSPKQVVSDPAEGVPLGIGVLRTAGRCIGPLENARLEGLIGPHPGEYDIPTSSCRAQLGNRTKSAVEHPRRTYRREIAEQRDCQENNFASPVRRLRSKFRPAAHDDAGQALTHTIERGDRNHAADG